jgi:hypothetical protein
MAKEDNPSALIAPQLGLLEDDIVYRLAMLAVNLLQPLKNKYPNIVITSGFRQTNSGIGQHELAEAVDIQIQNQTPGLMLEVANYIQSTLPFDQLILNFTNVADGRPWIHVSFSTNSLRRQVMTKDYSDTFHEGLYLVEPLVGEEEAAALRAINEQNASIQTELQNLQTRQTRLSPETTSIDDSSDNNSFESGDQPPELSRDVIELAQCVFNALGATADAFEITKRIAWLLRDIGCGLLVKTAGENITSWNGNSFSNGRICFPNGALYKIIGAAGPGETHFINGSPDGFVDPSRYMPAMDPGDSSGSWTSCALPS